MQRRDFLGVLGGAAAWPLAARAQQGDRMRRSSVLIAGAENDTLMQTLLTAFEQELKGLGWVSGRNVQIDIRLYRTRFFGHKFELSGLLHSGFLPGDTCVVRTA